MKTILIISLLLVTVACNPSPKQTTDDTGPAGEDTTRMTIQIPKTGCYVNISARDTVRLKVETFPNVVTGTLRYNFYEKDKNTGEIEGRLMGDTLLADYTFMSEGKRSTRQVIFLVRDSIAIEGYGVMEEKEGKMVFKDIREIDFSEGMKLVKVSCVEDIQL
ncbi:MAG: hypothetical protein ABS46_19795 [Cytophagaceae bacterium SCN 52-12]|nr:MAG: hypothetical protein ABS46_19795 [Cytophagaceae bacterium SCN 52-12]